MGVCASCLGLERRASNEADETDHLLDGEHAQYGAVEGSSQLDEDELRREREAYELITAEAADNMVDVSHPRAGEFGSQFMHSNHDRNADEENRGVVNDRTTEHGNEEADEAAWLEGLEAEGIDTMTPVRGLDNGRLILDMSQLRQDSTMNSTKRASKIAAIR